MPISADALGTTLGVWAHPDDEAYLTAGLMASGVRQGRRVACVTATRGEQGSWDEERWPTSEIGAVREAELMRSLEILGVTEHYWLDYPDGGCPDVDPEEAVGRVAEIMFAVRPRTVLTFGPDGMTGHPDHKAVSAWATEAFHRVAAPGARLFYPVHTLEWAEVFVPRFNRFNVFMEPGTPPVVPRDQLAIDFRLPPDLLELKLRAIAAHVSQVEGMMRAPSGRTSSGRGARRRPSPWPPPSSPMGDRGAASPSPWPCWARGSSSPGPRRSTGGCWSGPGTAGRSWSSPRPAPRRGRTSSSGERPSGWTTTGARA
ncbi:MAG TPA: PIG-L family deacetylase [Actinomycetota bacterium]|nr:PIG-L family deacetylase [Actinomycetota bacterium]